LDGGLSAEDYFELLAKNKKISGYSVSEELSKVGLHIDKKLKIKKYSKGMKQRLLLALALFGNPKTVILDEPTSGLDPFGKEEIEAYLLGLKDDRDFIISTHSLEFAYRFGIEIWILKEGAVVYRGIPSSLEELQRLFFENRPKGVA